MIVALYLGNMKMIVLLSLISTVCSCVHKNADKEVWFFRGSAGSLYLQYIKNKKKAILERYTIKNDCQLLQNDIIGR